MGGRPKPTKLKLLDGNPGKRPINDNEPKPRPVRPRCPSWLSKNAKKQWKKRVSALERLGLLTEIDDVAYALLCAEIDQFIVSDEFIQQKGIYFAVRGKQPADKEGNPLLDGDGKTIPAPIVNLIPFPQVAMRNRALQNIKSLLAEFGMTPAARSRISLTAEGEEDELAEILRRNKE